MHKKYCMHNGVKITSVRLEHIGHVVRMSVSGYRC